MEKIDTGTEHLIFEKENGVAVLTMNRPEARNAMSGEMNEAMRATLEEVELDPTIRCVVLTGAGKGFCAGGDVKGMASSGDGTVGDNTIDAAIHRQRVHSIGHTEPKTKTNTMLVHHGKNQVASGLSILDASDTNNF